MDAFNNPKVRRIIGMFSAQVAKTTIVENVVGYHAHHDPSPIMVIQPTLEIAETFSKDRLAPMIRDTPVLKAKFAGAGSKTSGDTILHKKFPGGSVTIAGANSFNSLASRPIRIVIGDEAAKWEPNEKGSPFRQSAARVRGFWNSKLAYFSTPTDASQNNEFNEIWEQSDKRLFFCPCPHCDAKAVFAFDETPGSVPSAVEGLPLVVLVWQEGKPIKADDGRTIRRADFAWFECKSCGSRIDDTERHRAVREGEWRATQQFYGTAGFWGWQAMSPFAAAVDIANEWLGALGNPAAQQSAKNETLGLPWTESGAAPEWKRLFDRAEDYRLGSVPDGALILTAGADIQADRIEVQVIGWGKRNLCWLVDYLILDGDTGRQEVWTALGQVLGNIYQNANGADYKIERIAVDTGFAAEQAYDWARKHKVGPVALIKGGPDSQTALVAAPSPVEISRNGKKIPSGLKIQLLNVGEFKKNLYSRLGKDLPNTEKGEDYEDGFFRFCRLPDTEEYCRQLTAEHLVSRKSPKGYQKREWEKVRARNEALDTWVYASAARIILGIDKFSAAKWEDLEAYAAPQAAQPKVVVPPQPARESWFGNRAGGNWINR